MELKCFSLDNVYDSLKNIVPISRDTLNCVVEKCNLINDSELISVNSANSNKKFLLIKSERIKNANGLNGSPDHYVVHPEFTLNNNFNELYLGFDLSHLEDFSVAERNNLEHLKLILKTLAEYHSECLNNKIGEDGSNNFDTDKYQKMVTNLDVFKDLDDNIINSSLHKLQEEVSALFKTDTSLTCLSCLHTQNIFISNDSNQCRFLQLSTPTHEPLAYDILGVIFSLTNKKFRQTHFEEAINLYFQYLFEHSKNGNCEVTRSSLERQIKVLLPVVKFEYASFLLHKTECQEELMEILTDIKHYLKFPFVNEEDIYQVLNNKLHFSDYNLVSYDFLPLKVKNGHLGEYYHLNIHYKHQNKPNQSRLFAKFIGSSTTLLQDLIDTGISKKEDFFYTIFLPALEENGLGDIINFSPKCYLSKKPWLLVMDDLSTEGFVSLEPNKSVEYDGLGAILEKLAMFHAATILLEERLSQKSGKRVTLYDIYGEFLEESVLIDDEANKFKDFLRSNINGVKQLIRIMPEVTNKFDISPEELDKRLEEVYLEWIKRVAKSDKYRNVICHGDMYISNTLLKYNETGSIIEAQLIDFQVLRYCPLGHDVLFFIYISSFRETRLKYMDKLLEEYYSKFSGYIDRFGYDSKVVYPKEVFDQSISYMKSQAIMHAHSYSLIMHLDTEKKNEIMKDNEKLMYYANEGKNELIEMAIKTHRHRRILSGLLEDLLVIVDTKEY